MSTPIREFEDADATAAAALFPDYDVATADELRHRIRARDARAWVAETGRGVAGFGLAWLVGVTGRVRLHGDAQDELLHRAERDLLARGAIRISTFAPERRAEELELRGFTPERRTVVQELEPTAQGVVPEHVVSLADAAELEPALHELWNEVQADLPPPVPPALGLDGWRADVLRRPGLSAGGSFVALHEGEPAAFAFLTVDPARGIGQSSMTGTRARLRGRGLATAAKRASIDWAARAGLTRIYTGNDERNDPMLAVNRKLGYRPIETLVQLIR